MRAGDGSILAALLGVGIVLSPALDRSPAPTPREAAPGGSAIATMAIPTAPQAAPRPVVADAPTPVAAPLTVPATPVVMLAPEVVEGDALARFEAIADRGVAFATLHDGTLAPADGAFALDGRPVVVHIAASWCRPCADELARFTALAARVPRAVLVMTDDVGGPAGLLSVAELLAERAEASSRAWPAGLELRADPDWAWAKWLGRETLPLTAVIFGDGRLALVATGPLDDDATARVAMLAEARP